MPLRLYNSLKREKQVFTPADPKRVTLYVCGPTVYNHAHIGNFRPVIVFDTLYRLLRNLYGREHVLYARNITDIEDKIIAKAGETGQSLSEVTQKYAAIYQNEAAALNALPPDLEPWATHYIPQMIDLIKTLVEKDHAYIGPSGVWFHVPSMADYGALSGRRLEDNAAGARVDVNTEKRDPADFALWKFAKADEPEEAIWPSPWGDGRPGWHIECSAMAAACLGQTIDIHGGGVDLKFPHHENEIAQSECAHDQRMARYWMHNGFLDMSGEKMSKSLGNVVLLKDLLEDWPGEIIRFAMLSGHYRMPLDWSPQLLSQAKTTLDRLYGALDRVWEARAESHEVAGENDRVKQALEDDLNTPEALAALSHFASEANRAAEQGDEAKMAAARAHLLSAGALLGLLQTPPKLWLQGERDEDAAYIDGLIEARQAARQAKDWAEADRLRDVLSAQGVEIMDTKDGISWRRV